MKEFEKGIVCALSVVLFGRVMYKLGMRKTARYFRSKIDEELNRREKEESKEES